MSPRTKARRRRRKAIAAIAAIIRSEPRRTDPEFVRIYARGPKLVADMAFYASYMKWEMTHSFVMMTRSYDAARATVHPEL